VSGGRPGRKRADQLLVDRGLAESRARAQALILAGGVRQGERRVDKPGDLLPADAELAVKTAGHPWVSRGGIKLAHGLDQFAIAPAGLACLDLGASTGGFTDVLLSRGAARVYAVDVGHGQLAWSLRNDPRVVVLERTNARHLGRGQVPEPVGLIVCDVSFISLLTVLPPALALAAPGARLVALIKPQFEVGKGRVGKGGVVRDPALHASVCDKVKGWLAEQPGWSVLGVSESPIRGPEGNVEFLIGAAHEGGQDP
jgi:23S rRNA (cytidine1920-2'-O)/16S rRNA (cytidine1409-2'-O)-methyltransferase